MESKNYWKSDIDNGLLSIKIGIKNLINYLIEQPPKTKVRLSGIHINLVKQCIAEQKFKSSTTNTIFGVTIKLPELGILIDCTYDIDEIEFLRFSPVLEKELDFI